MSKIYIAGKITGLENFKEVFEKAEKELTLQGYTVMNPARLNKGFSHEEYMKICYAMIDACDKVYMLKNAIDSKGAIMEHQYAMKNNKKIIYEGEI